MITQIDALEIRIAALETPVPVTSTACDPDGNGAINAEELASYLNNEGFLMDVNGAQLLIGTIDPNRSQDIDEQRELDALNAYFSQNSIPECSLNI